LHRIGSAPAGATGANAELPGRWQLNGLAVKLEPGAPMGSLAATGGRLHEHTCGGNRRAAGSLQLENSTSSRWIL